MQDLTKLMVVKGVLQIFQLAVSQCVVGKSGAVGVVAGV